MTAFERGGMERKLCSRTSSECWSLHALWDAEMLKIIDQFQIFESDSENEERYGIDKWAVQINKIICKIYVYPEYYFIEDYVEKFKNLSVNLVKKASYHIASVLNSKASWSPLEINNKCKWPVLTARSNLSAKFQVINKVV